LQHPEEFEQKLIKALNHLDNPEMAADFTKLYEDQQKLTKEFSKGLTGFTIRPISKSRCETSEKSVRRVGNSAVSRSVTPPPKPIQDGLDSWQKIPAALPPPPPQPKSNTKWRFGGKVLGKDLWSETSIQMPPSRMRNAQE
jgi:hypothetical protein